MQYTMKVYGGVDVHIHVFLLSSLVGVGGEWSVLLPCCFILKGPQYPLDRRLGGPESVWNTWKKFLTLPGLKLNPSVVQPIANRYTAYDIMAPPEFTHTPIQVSNIFQFQIH
jgi:hypothetical protein